MRRKDLTGLKVGHVTVVECLGSRKHKSGKSVPFWRCKCECGNLVDLFATKLFGNDSGTSCGCIKPGTGLGRVVDANSDGRVRHHLTRTKEYRIWASMRRRCRDKRSRGYENYGGRGISVCERWNYFVNFLADMGKRPSADHSIDRINNDGDYEPSNCRWATKMEQMANTRQMRKIEFNGEIHHVSEWERILKLPMGSLAKRLFRGWTLERAMTTPPMKNQFVARGV